MAIIFGLQIFVRTFTGPSKQKSPLKISGKIAVGVLRDSRKISGRIVIFAVAQLSCFIFSTFFSVRQHICYRRAICYHPYVCLSGKRVDQSKTVEVRTMQLSPHSIPMTLVSSWLSQRYSPYIKYLWLSSSRNSKSKGNIGSGAQIERGVGKIGNF